MATKVLFLCSKNTARSQMAEAFLRKFGGDRFEACSAGLEAGPDIHPLTRRVMNEIGLDLGGQYPKALRAFLGRDRVDVVVFVCDKAEQSCPFIWPSAVAGLSWPFDDPAACTGTEEEQLQKFRTVRDEIAARVRDWVRQSETTAC